MTKRYAAIFPRVISCCPKSSGQNRDRGQSYYGDSNCRELDVSIDNGWQGSKVYSPRSLSIEYPNKARTEDPPARPPWKPFPSVNRVRIHPSGSATTTRTHGWNMDGRKRKWLCSNTCVPEQSEGKGGGGWMQMLDLRLPTTLVYCRIICFGSKRKKGLARWSNEACKRVGNLGRGDD